MKKVSRKALRKKADTIFSKYIRTKYADDNGFVFCYTCGSSYPIKKIQCGHFISRGKLAVRYNEDNARPQCYVCNCLKFGEQFIFGQRLIDEGVDIDELYKLSHSVEKVDYEEIIEKYKKKLKKLS